MKSKYARPISVIRFAAGMLLSALGALPAVGWSQLPTVPLNDTVEVYMTQRPAPILGAALAFGPH